MANKHKLVSQKVMCNHIHVIKYVLSTMGVSKE